MGRYRMVVKFTMRRLARRLRRAYLSGEATPPLPSSKETPVTDVLIVDDDRVACETFASVLRGAGYEATVAENAMEAVLELHLRPAHVIVCDVRMPYVGGTDFYAQLLAELPAMAERVVFVTGATDRETMARVEDTGRPCLAKPVDGAELVRTVGTVAHRTRESS
jgi:CheY-like chemotaxis protein